MFFFTYGLRAEWNPNYGDEAQPNLAPRYGVSYIHDFGPISLKLRASYGRSTRPPQEGLKMSEAQTIAQSIAQYGPYDRQLANPELGPEHQQGGEGGLELYLNSRGSLVVTRYNQTVDKLISSISGVDSLRSLTSTPLSLRCSSSFRELEGYCYGYQSQYLNVGSIRNQGWELQGSLNTGAITTRGIYSWTKSRVLGITPKYRALLASNSGFEPGRSFSFLPEHTWAVGLTYSRAVSMVSVTLNGIGALYRQSDDLRMALEMRLRTTVPRTELPTAYRPLAPGYVTADMNATRQFTSHVEGLLQVTNLTDYYRNDYGPNSPTIGRQTRLGLRFRLQ